MPDREIPVRPDLRRLKKEAKELHRATVAQEPSALADLRKHHPENIAPEDVRLTDAQLVLARSYGISSWPRLVLACQLIDAIWRDDVAAVRELIVKHPRLLHEHARGVPGNWGNPMSYAANLGRQTIISALREMGALDVQFAFERATLQGQLATARQLMDMGARPRPGSVMGPAETLNPEGLELLLSLGAPISDEAGNRLAPVAMVLEGYGRDPAGKHRCLELFAEHGIAFPDTPPMAVHRGRLDLLEDHLRADPQLLSRRFAHREIYPPELGCSEDESLALHGTPLAGATLLHMCIDYDELEIASWIVAHGGNPDAKAAVDAHGFGGHTPLFSCVVSQANRGKRRADPKFARLLLDSGADPNARASLRKRLRFVADESLHEYHDVTPLSWGRRFHHQEWVSLSVLRLIEERGGHD
jgi:hypothetical protein